MSIEKISVKVYKKSEKKGKKLIVMRMSEQMQRNSNGIEKVM